MGNSAYGKLSPDSDFIADATVQPTSSWSFAL